MRIDTGRAIKKDGHKTATAVRPATALKKRDAPVLLAMSAGIRPETALWRASAVAERTQGRLMVVVCLPRDDQVNILFPHKNNRDMGRRLRQEDAVGLRVWRWCNKNLLTPLPSDAMLVRRGDLATCAASTAREMKAHLVVLSEQDSVSGSDVATIVEDTGVTVLLSRATRPNNAVIAATDMTLRGYPVVREGAAVAKLLGAPLTVVHNVQPQVLAPIMLSAEGTMFLPIVSADERGRTRRQRAKSLEAGVADIEVAETRVVEEADTVGALLGLAKSQEADLVVVGHRRRSWLGRVFGKSVAARVVNRSVRSIMVVPVSRDRSAKDR